MSQTFKVPRNDEETWLGATLRHATQHGYGALAVMAMFATHCQAGCSEEEAAINTLLELDITPLAKEGVSGT